MAAVILLVGVMAAFRFLVLDGKGKAKALSVSGDKAGVVWLEGDIESSYDLVEWIRELRDDDSVKGVLLRVDSGGGAVGPSREIYAAVQKLQAAKPVIAYFQSVAASGAYYASAPADAIVCNPMAITGSIGVLMPLQNYQGLMDKLGVTDQTLATSPFKDAGSPTKPMTAEQKAYLQGVIDDMYEQFVADVAAAREMDPQKLRALADGKVMTGAKALEAGLVDYLGDDEDAMDMLLKQAGLPADAPVVEGPEFEQNWLDKLMYGLQGLFSDVHVTIGGSAPRGPAFR